MSLRDWFRRGKHPMALLRSFKFTLKYFPQTETNLSKCSSHLCLRYRTLPQVSDLRLLLVPQVPPAPALLLFHTRTSPFIFISGCTWKSNVRKNHFHPWRRAIVSRLQASPCERLGWECQENTGTPSPNAKLLHWESPLSRTAGIACHLRTHP